MGIENTSPSPLFQTLIQGDRIYRKHTLQERVAVVNLNLMLDPPFDRIAARRALSQPFRDAARMENMPAGQLGHSLAVCEGLETNGALVLIERNPVGLIRNFTEGGCHINN